ncbi:TPA: hypothetical protein U1W10_000026 [Streptococcus suis]|nr:hypothetical protein [Streptococcus suis]
MTDLLMDTSWLEPLKDYFSYKVPIGVILIILLVVIMFYLVSTGHIRKSTKIALETLQKSNKDLRDYVDKLQLENDKLRKRNIEK